MNGRKLTSNHPHELLHSKMFEYQEQIEPRIKQKCLYNKDTIYTENALYFFLHSKKSNTDWILTNLNNFKDPFRSMFTLVISFRGTVQDIDILRKEHDYFTSKYQSKSYN